MLSPPSSDSVNCGRTTEAAFVIAAARFFVARYEKFAKIVGMNAEKGFVYILTNPSFREDWVKIGKSSRPVDIRSKELDNTAVPLPFEIFATLKTSKYERVEKLLHKTIDRLTALRIRQNREFFNVAPQVALDLLKDIAATIDDAEITEYASGNPKAAPRNACGGKASAETDSARRPPFEFRMAGVKIGEKVTFDPAKIEVVVADEKHVEYKGRLYTLSAFAGTFMPADLRNESGAYQGPKFFSCHGKTLRELRREREGE